MPSVGRGTAQPKCKTLVRGRGADAQRGAREAGVPVSTLRRWEANRGLPGLPALLRLAQALGVPPERFAEGVEDPAGDEPEPGGPEPRPVRKERAP